MQPQGAVAVPNEPGPSSVTVAVAAACATATVPVRRATVWRCRACGAPLGAVEPSLRQQGGVRLCPSPVAAAVEEVDGARVVVRCRRCAAVRLWCARETRLGDVVE